MMRRVLPYLVVVLGHLALVSHFVSLETVFTDEPISGDDFDLHIGQTWRAVEGLEKWGHSWVYDVDLLAGEPSGVIVDSGNKGWSLWTFALSQLGLSRAVAFNTFVLFGHLLAPLAVFACGRLFRLTAGSSLVAAALSSCFWFFDSFSHWVWWVGMCSYATASSFALLPLGLFYRFTEERQRGAAVLCAPLLGLSLLIHPYSFFILAVPMAWMVVRQRKVLEPLDLGLVGGIVATALAINAYWLLNAAAHWHYILDSAYFGQTGIGHLVADFFSVLLDPTDTGVIGTRTGFRFLICGLAIGGLLTWRERGDRRLSVLGGGFAFLLLLAYLGGSIPGASQIQPYRNMIPAGFVGSLLAAVFLEHLVRSGSLRVLQWPARAALIVASVVGMQHLGRDVLYFFPALVPESPALIDGMPSPISGYGYVNHFKKPEHVPYRIPHPAHGQVGVDAVVAWIDKRMRPGDRVLVDHAVLGERIAWKTDIEVIGGFRERNIDHAYANFFRRFGDGEVDPDTLREYLRTFAVNLIVLVEPRKDLDAATAVVKRQPPLFGMYFYLPRERYSHVLDGPGRVAADTNRIAVEGTDGARDVTLSYHWHESLICKPDCRIERAEVPLDDVGLVRVPAPHPAAFVIENGYR